MCYHKSNDFKSNSLAVHYHTNLPEEMANDWDKESHFHENGFDHKLSPVLTHDGWGYFNWGLVPWFTKTQQDANMIRIKTLNCVSEEMFDKPSFRDSVKEHQFCLIPTTGFFEWKWQDSKGKEKTPYYIHLKDQKIFSLAGIYSSWTDKSTDKTIYTYSVLTTAANPLMEEIHNMKKRMPVIISKEYEKDFLNPNLTKEDILALCQPFDQTKMDAYTISKRITSRKDPTNVPQVLEKAESGLLF